MSLECPLRLEQDRLSPLLRNSGAPVPAFRLGHSGSVIPVGTTRNADRNLVCRELRELSVLVQIRIDDWVVGVFRADPLDQAVGNLADMDVIPLELNAAPSIRDCERKPRAAG
jgi:hypothetical protein